MSLHQLAAVAGLTVTALTVIYVSLREFQQYRTATATPSLLGFLVRIRPLLSTTAAVLVVAALLHAGLVAVSAGLLAVPVWVLAVFVVVMTGSTQLMPGDSFEEKLARTDRQLRAEETAADRDEPDEHATERDGERHGGE